MVFLDLNSLKEINYHKICLFESLDYVATNLISVLPFCSWRVRGYLAGMACQARQHPGYKCINFFTHLSDYFYIYISLIPGLSDPQIGPWHQSSERSDGRHEGAGGGGGQGWQH